MGASRRPPRLWRWRPPLGRRLRESTRPYRLTRRAPRRPVPLEAAAADAREGAEGTRQELPEAAPRSRSTAIGVETVERSKCQDHGPTCRMITNLGLQMLGYIEQNRRQCQWARRSI